MTQPGIEPRSPGPLANTLTARPMSGNNNNNNNDKNNNNNAFGKHPQRLRKSTGRLRNQRTNGDDPNYSIINIGQNTEKSPGDLRRLAVAQTPVKDQ